MLHCGLRTTGDQQGMEWNGGKRGGGIAQSSQRIIIFAECSKNLCNNKQCNKSRGPREGVSPGTKKQPCDLGKSCFRGGDGRDAECERDGEKRERERERINEAIRIC